MGADNFTQWSCMVRTRVAHIMEMKNA